MGKILEKSSIKSSRLSSYTEDTFDLPVPDVKKDFENAFKSLAFVKKNTSTFRPKALDASPCGK
jgi:hypothetical protein